MPSIRIDGWRSSVRFDAAHFIPGHPKCGRLHGHTYAIHAVVHGEAAESGFILDFGDVKKALKAVADDLDHHVLVQVKSPVFGVKRLPEGVAFTVHGKRYQFPLEDVKLLPVEWTTAESLAEYVADEILARVAFPKGVTAIEIGVDESYGKGAWTTRDLSRKPRTRARRG